MSSASSASSTEQAPPVVEDNREGPNIDQILDVEVEVVVRFGQVEMTLRDVAKLTTGSVVELDRGVDEPAELVVNNTVFATGEVVVADGHYALRIHKILTPSERIRSLGK